jgi:hypothetical protein
MIGEILECIIKMIVYTFLMIVGGIGMLCLCGLLNYLSKL